MTSCRDAIKAFEGSEVRNPKKEKAEEAVQVKLYFMIPPIQKMDPAALSTLKGCEHLALSSNSIDKIANLSGMDKLRILSVGRNNIRKLENLDAIADRLEELWMSYNPVANLAGIEKLQNLKVLYMGNCKVSERKEFMRLCELPKLEEIVFYGNPIHKGIADKDGELEWAKYVMEILPDLRKLDGITCVEWKTKASEGNSTQLEEIFNKMDADGSGDVTISEMKSALADDEICAFCKLSPGRVEEIFEQLAKDGTNSMNLDTFKSVFSS